MLNLGFKMNHADSVFVALRKLLVASLLQGHRFAHTVYMCFVLPQAKEFMYLHVL